MLSKKCMCWCFIHYWIEKCTVKQWHPVNTSHHFRFVYKYFAFTLFSSNGNSYTIYTQSVVCTCTYILTVYSSSLGKSNKKGTAVNTAWQRNLSACHFAHACPLLGGPGLGSPRQRHNSHEPWKLSAKWRATDSTARVPFLAQHNYVIFF